MPKHPRLVEKQKAEEKRAWADYHLSVTRREYKLGGGERIAKAIEVADGERAKSPNDRSTHLNEMECFLVKATKVERKYFIKLLYAIQDKNEFFREEKVIFNIGTLDNSPMTGLTRLAIWGPYWVRNPEDWKPKSHNLRKKFSSLTHWLLGKYQIPKFLDSAWFGPDGDSWVYQNWYVHVAQGGNIRKADDLPIKYTKRMSHYFMQSPDMAIGEALRRGQVMGYGGSEKLANAIIGSKIGKIKFEKTEKFWLTVIHFLINNPMLDHVHVGPIIDYINNQKFVDRGRAIVDGLLVHLGPLQPRFTMKGRTGISLLRLVEGWHKELTKIRGGKEYTWDSCGVGGYEESKGRKSNAQIWTISELLDSKSLRSEGKAMRNCVYSYARSCHSGNEAIYSMTCLSSTGLKNMATISISVIGKTVTEVRGACNASPTPFQFGLVSRWAAKRGLHISVWVKNNAR